jgi:hypothetical protein
MFKHFLKSNFPNVFSEVTHGPRWEVCMFMVVLLLLEYLLIPIWPPGKAVLLINSCIEK